MYKNAHIHSLKDKACFPNRNENEQIMLKQLIQIQNNTPPPQKKKKREKKKREKTKSHLKNTEERRQRERKQKVTWKALKKEGRERCRKRKHSVIFLHGWERAVINQMHKWNCFKVNTGETSERLGGGHNDGFFFQAHRYNLDLNLPGKISA